MTRVQKSSRAETDLIEISEYIATHNLTAALHWVDEIDQTFKLLARNPHLGEEVDDLAIGVRRQTFGNYLIFYCPSDDGIAILRVLHGSRHIESLRD